MKLKVWAPKAKKVEININREKQLPMHPIERGWWEIEIPAKAGTNYAFIVDDSKPLPDPRSQFQPNGVHDFSQIVDHTAFQWTDQNWQTPPLSSAIIYELHIGTFTKEGTFSAAKEKLDYLKNLGITHVELMPINEFAGSRGWGYDGVDLYAPHHNYGTPDDLKSLVNACHEKGLTVILDVVYNHLGPSGNYLGFYAPYFTDRYSTPWGDAVNFDGSGSDEVRKFFIENALMWLQDYHFDGLRIDAVHAIYDMSATHFLEELAEEVKFLQTKLGRHLFLIAESDLNNPRIIRAPEVGGYGIEAQWDDDFHHALHTVLTGENNGYYKDFGGLKHLAKSLSKAYVYDGQYSVFRNRKHGRPVKELSGDKFVGFLQNHDQIGNRAQGKRISHLTNIGRVKIGAALVMLSPFIPLIFQGEEWAAATPFQFFTDHQESKLAQAVREGRRKEFTDFGWDPEEIPDPQDKETFLRSKLNWEELVENHHSEILEWHRKLIEIRKDYPCLREGKREKVRVEFSEAENWLKLGRSEIIMICNLSEKERKFFIEPQIKKELLLSHSQIKTNSDYIKLPPDSVGIWEVIL